LYGIELEQNKVELKHIDLTAEHLKLDTAEEFIFKTENALRNLYRLYQSDRYRAILKHYIKLVKANNALWNLRLTTLAFFIYDRLGKKMRRKLTGGNTNLRLLDMYKLLFFISLQKKKP
jgi:hypothetical protein